MKTEFWLTSLKFFFITKRKVVVLFGFLENRWLSSWALTAETTRGVWRTQNVLALLPTSSEQDQFSEQIICKTRLDCQKMCFFYSNITCK